MARERKGMTQRDLAEAAKTSHGFISVVENAEDGANHGAETLRALAKALGVPFTWVLNIPGAPEPNWGTSREETEAAS